MVLSIDLSIKGKKVNTQQPMCASLDKLNLSSMQFLRKTATLSEACSMSKELFPVMIQIIKSQKVDDVHVDLKECDNFQAQIETTLNQKMNVFTQINQDIIYCLSYT
eukprot:TRINITY_DN9235_c0_g1_i1.p2 TRINITY_DN9235_c0_g1~~TRINITY_DN9235_c0_g1_i1.p2  ORF type:complete len:107 (-),score=4.26 TRINITY_DN9235_c0_g1_i1:110-430(-)